MIANENAYLNMLCDILKKKEEILRSLIEETKKQEEALCQTETDMDSFEAAIEKKDELIKKINESDSAFEKIYKRVAQTLKENTAQYAQAVSELKKGIITVTELSASLYALEKKNKNTMENLANVKKRGVTQFAKNRQTADRYYKNMMGTGNVDSVFIDKKE